MSPGTHFQVFSERTSMPRTFRPLGSALSSLRERTFRSLESAQSGLRGAHFLVSVLCTMLLLMMADLTFFVR